MFYCLNMPVIQVASSSWRRMLSTQAKGSTFTLDIHSRRLYPYVDVLGTYMLIQSPVAKQQPLKKYFKFMFVRHPFDRLVSAYLDKFIHPMYVL